MPDDVSVSESMSTWGVVNVDSTDDGNPTADLRVPSSKLPWAICALRLCYLAINLFDDDPSF